MNSLKQLASYSHQVREQFSDWWWGSYRIRRMSQWRYEWRWRYGLDRWYEKRYRVKTLGRVSLEDLGIQAADSIWYEPSEWFSVGRAIRSLPVALNDVFIDFGSGKGRVLLIAAQLPFKRMIGVELSSELNDLARQNVARTTLRLRCGNIELVTADSVNYEVPDDVTVAYFYSPFISVTFSKVLDNLIRSVDRSPRPLRILYNYPVEHNRVLATGRVQVINVQRRKLGARRLSSDVIVTYLVLHPETWSASASFLRRAAKNVRGAEAWLGQYDPGFELGGVPIPRPPTVD